MSKGPMCHFTEMNQTFADDGPDTQTEFWECSYCGHTKSPEEAFHYIMKAEARAVRKWKEEEGWH